jgi:menaquinone-dependent protoporphyrinogen oxidase
MSKALVAYTSKYGSTGEVAQAIADELKATGAVVDLRPVKEVGDVREYDFVVVGGPMIMGWHREAVRFVVKNQQALSRKHVAYFFTAKAVTKTGEGKIDQTTIFQDPGLAKPPRNPAKLSFREKEATPHHYLGPVLKKAPAVKPLAAAFFGGKLDYGRLNVFERLFVKRIVGAPEGDSRNWEVIRAWARELAPHLSD